MIFVEELKTLFYEKLKKTNSLDEAFLKAVWTAYNQGIKDEKGRVKDGK